ncbi:putative baseplate assembly protein [Ancylothrix sp. C2]|uniref:putative baseplate assembly protein n=1 Tax=Ancylothrix sp. D3o TaxID=2953691 RepID=UPI0021BAA29F|nr:putative baseplate assembly protein [Ancylothrix sp. D3o]MCT7948227.1 putative baseplate assembly protein [Ancylothrix sp. D3o]
MEFNFLPKLPKSNLDDRTFEDLVEECLVRIPRYCPEWTNYNPSDPGITLIELFAWLSDQMFARFNQVPRRNYIAFLELLGIRLNPPAPAQTAQTFYLSAALPETYTIPAGTEIATPRTENEEAIIFSTDRPLTIASPRIRHFLTAENAAENQPQMLRDRWAGTWRREPDGHWQGLPLAIFNEQPQPGNSFYLAFEPDQPSEGNVIALTLTGLAATPTGINPEQPPRHWEAWDGQTWQPVLLRESDDNSKGFSFNNQRQNNNPLQAADVVLHLPQQWPVVQFVTYVGRWLRCTCTPPKPNQPSYSSSPRIVGLNVRSIGGTVQATQSTLIRNELLGESDGTPGQTFVLQNAPLLPRRDTERLLVTPPGGLPQLWQEVSDFASSGPQDLHYTIDDLTGTIQFGPLIREPGQLQQQTRLRTAGQTATSNQRAAGEADARHYGAVPPRGSTIQMVAYRTGGGQKGNVQAGTITMLKSAVPYVARVINHTSARNGADAESLEEAVIRVPRLLRTRDRAVTSEDFETLAKEGGRGAVARVLCLSPTRKEQAGRVELLLVPQTNITGIDAGTGIDPDFFNLSPQLTEQVQEYLDERRLLGVQVTCRQPEYVGVAVQTEISLEPEYNNPSARQEILLKAQVALYRFLNPLCGGPEGTGWPFGRPAYPSDIITLLQKIAGIRYLGAVQLFELRRQGSTWERIMPREPTINPGPLGLIVSWRNDQLRSGHTINLI